MKKILSILFLVLLMIYPAFAADEWRDNSTTFFDGDTTLFNDIETEVLDHILGPLDRLNRGYRKGCKISFASTSTLTVGTGEVFLSNSDGTLFKMKRNTSTTTVQWSDIDTGAEASDTTYYVYAVADTSDTTFTVKISTSSSAPSGVTYYRRLGSFYNNSSSNITYGDIVNDDNYYALMLGDWESKSFNTTYQATTDGFAVGYMEIPSGGGGASGGILAYTDASSSPSTLRTKGYITQNSEAVSVTIPVKRGHYWNFSKSGGSGNNTALYWIPNE